MGEQRYKCRPYGASWAVWDTLIGRIVAVRPDEQSARKAVDYLNAHDGKD
jgi:hypothetical protein